MPTPCSASLTTKAVAMVPLEDTGTSLMEQRSQVPLLHCLLSIGPEEEGTSHWLLYTCTGSIHYQLRELQTLLVWVSTAVRYLPVGHMETSKWLMWECMYEEASVVSTQYKHKSTIGRAVAHYNNIIHELPVHSDIQANV